MKALSIQQPWAWAILYLGKRVENRTWYTNFRGPIYLHAGKKLDLDGMDSLEPDIREALRDAEESGETLGKIYCGYLVGTARITDCVRPDAVDGPGSGWANGPWCFLLDDVEALPVPIPCKGALGFFTPHPSAQAERGCRE